MYKSKYLNNNNGNHQAIPYDVEKKLITHILQGKAEQALSVIREILALDVSELPLEEQRYLLATLISFCARKLIQKGASKEEAFSIQQCYFKALRLADSTIELRDIIDDVVCYYASYFDHIHKHSYSYHVQRVMNYIEENLQNHLTVNSISENLGLNNAYLSTLFKQETGQSIKKKITESKIDYAKELLHTSNKTIQEISAILGFSSQSLFSQRFKDIVSISPTEYRSLLSM